MLASIFDTFVKQSPISVMMRGVMERVFRVERIDEIFETHAKLQYTRELLFSSLVPTFRTFVSTGDNISGKLLP